MKITEIRAMEILDSRGFPTVRAFVTLNNGIKAKASVPSGASTGSFEAVELRDGDKIRYGGKGVLNAVKNVNEIIAPALKGRDPSNYVANDKIMFDLDGTPNKSKLGANAILSVSLAAAKAAAKCENLPLYKFIGGEKAVTLPTPICNVINGGAHATNNVDVQEFMIAPVGAKSFSEGLRFASETFQNLKRIIKNKGMPTAVGDEGGFAPDLATNEEALALLDEAVEAAGYTGRIKFALDPASTEWMGENGVYIMPKSDLKFTKNQLIDYWKDLVGKYPIISIEDGLNEEDWDTWVAFTKKTGKKIQIVGDDLFVTNTARIQKGIDMGAANSVLIKPNQIGSLSETEAAVRLAHKNGYTAIMSHRSGETEDTTIADLAVGLGTEQIKTGSLSRSERIAKYNRLLEIEAELGERAAYLGEKAFKA
jgi:phosphopyruvate hydratase